jgi:hypothetical protein
VKDDAMTCRSKNPQEALNIPKTVEPERTWTWSTNQSQKVRVFLSLEILSQTREIISNISEYMDYKILPARPRVRRTVRLHCVQADGIVLCKPQARVLGLEKLDVHAFTPHIRDS